MEGTPTAVLTIIGIFSVFILLKKNKRNTDYLLFSINLFLAASLIADIWINKSISAGSLFLHFNASFWIISAFFTYAYSMIHGRLVLKWYHFAFAIPFFLYSSFDLFFDFTKTAESYQAIYYDPNLVYLFFFKFHQIFVILLGIDLLKKIKRYQLNLKESHSYIEHISLDWLRNYTLFIVLLYGVMLICFLAYNVGWMQDISLAYLIINILVVIAVFYLSFHGIKQYNTPAPVSTIAIPKKTDLAKRKEENHPIYTELINLFEQEKIYKDPQLRIGVVANQLNVSSHKLSETINSEFGKPFYHFVAQYRTEELKKMLIDPSKQNYTILALALEAGFNSKATLNRIFKEQTGFTPSQFQKSHQSKDGSSSVKTGLNL